MTETLQQLLDLLLFASVLMLPVWIAVVVCVVRGIKAEIRERRRR